MSFLQDYISCPSTWSSSVTSAVCRLRSMTLKMFFKPSEICFDVMLLFVSAVEPVQFFLVIKKMVSQPLEPGSLSSDHPSAQYADSPPAASISLTALHSQSGRSFLCVVCPRYYLRAERRSSRRSLLHEQTELVKTSSLPPAPLQVWKDPRRIH